MCATNEVCTKISGLKMEFNLINFRKKKKEEAKKAEMASTEEEDCSAPKCKRPTGKQVCVPVTVFCFPQNH